MKNFKKISKRCPDFAIWGPDRLTGNGWPRGNPQLEKVVNPHVIFQFGWTNTLDYEKDAIDDMSLVCWCE
jgi:hypothetical protein